MLCIIRCRAFFVTAGDPGRKENKMIMPKRIKDVIKEKPEKSLEEEMKQREQAIYLELDAACTDSKYDSDLSPSETLASEIVFRLAAKAAESFTGAVDGLNIISIKQLVSMMEDAESEEAVGMLQAVLLSNGKRTDAEMLDLLNFCKMYYEGAFDDFIDCFMQADEIDWFVVDNWLDEYRSPTEGMKIVNGRLLDVEGDCCM